MLAPLVAALGVNSAFDGQHLAGRPGIRIGQVRLGKQLDQGPDAEPVDPPLAGELIRVAAPLDDQGLVHQAHFVAPGEAKPEVVVFRRRESLIETAVVLKQAPVQNTAEGLIIQRASDGRKICPDTFRWTAGLFTLTPRRTQVSSV